MTIRPIGNKAEAEKALYGMLDYIGAGSFRKVYRSKDGLVVYKVCTDDPNELVAAIDEANWAEHNNYWEMRKKGFRCMARPYIWRFQYNGRERVVIAQKYHNGPRDINTEIEFVNAMERFIPDIDYGGNVQFTKRGKPIVTDIQLFDPEGKYRMMFGTKTVNTPNTARENF